MRFDIFSPHHGGDRVALDTTGTPLEYCTERSVVPSGTRIAGGLRDVIEG